jgi:EPS-associated MarR family transcriptional regulator
MTPREEAHFRILKALENNPDLTQRELAEEVGLSLGKTNYQLNALINKGAVKLGNFQRDGNKLNKIAYLLTPSGFSERLRLTQGYLARKKAEYEALQAEIEALEKDDALEIVRED